MRLITASELAGKTNFELSALYASIIEELGRAAPGSHEYEVLAISLDNIRRTYAARQTRGPRC